MGKKINIMAQHLHYAESGAYTGNFSYKQALDCGIKTSIIGHSETREQMNVSNEQINKTIKVMLKNSMKPIFCIGETSQQYESKQTAEVIEQQIKAGFKDIDINRALNIVIAYEPI